MEDRVDAALVGLQAVHQVLLETLHAIGQDARAVQQAVDQERLEDVEFELAVHATDSSGNVVTHHLRADHGQGLALGRVHLPGHDRRAGLVLREDQLSQTATGTGSEVADILGDLEERAGKGVERARGLDDRIVGGQNLELVRGGLELGSGHFGNLGRDRLVKALEGVQTCPDGSTALGQVAEMGQSILDALDITVELGDIAGELLAKSKGRGILKVGTADLDELVELLHLDLESIAQALQGRQDLVLQVQDSSDVHGGREGVVGRGRHVDVVIGVDGLLGAHGSSHDLDRTVRNDFVGVHVALGTGTGLPNDEREVVHELALSDLGSGLLDSLTNLGVYNH